MSERPWWAHAIQWGLWFLAMTLVMGWLARTRQREPERTSDAVILRPPRSILWLGVTGALFFLALSIAALLTTKGSRGVFYFISFNAFTLLSAPLIASYYRDRVVVREDHFDFQTTIFGSGSAQWSDITEISYSHSMKWFRLALRSGRVVRVSVMMIGLPVLAEKLLSHASGATISETDRNLLRATAGGHAPSVWM